MSGKGKGKRSKPRDINGDHAEDTFEKRAKSEKNGTNGRAALKFGLTEALQDQVLKDKVR
jgi:hypothetical protein